MKITGISIQNYMGIVAFKVSKLGKFNKISGKNGTGKTAVLKAITEAFKSSGVSPEKIRLNEDQAEIMVTLDSGVEVRRRLTPSTNTVKVVQGDQPIDSPQSFLNALQGVFQFNPVEFFSAKPKERRDMMLRAVEFKLNKDALLNALPEDLRQLAPMGDLNFDKHGLDLLDQFRDIVFETRAEVNRDITRLGKSIEQSKLEIPDTFNPKLYEGFDFDKAMAELDKETAKEAAWDRKNRDLQGLRDDASSKLARIESLTRELAEEQAALDLITENGKALKAELELRPSNNRPAELKEALSGYNTNRQYVQKSEEISTREIELETTRKRHELYDRLYSQLVKDIPRTVMASLKFPVDGVEVKKDKIFVNGVSIDELSTSEQVKFSLAIARSLSGPLKVICVDKFESLDPDAQTAFEKATASDDFEYFVTNVTTGDLAMEAKDPGPVESQVGKSKTTRPSHSTTIPAGNRVGF